MAIATTLRGFTQAMHTGNEGWLNLYFADETGISPATPLTITSSAQMTGASGGTITVTPYQELPNLGWKCRITAVPRGSNYLILRGNNTVSG